MSMHPPSNISHQLGEEIKDMKKISLALTCVLALASNSSFAAPKECYANYMLDTERTIATGRIYLDKVKGLNKKKKCKELAMKNCARAKAKLLDYAPVGSANMKSICNKGKFAVYVDSEVKGKKNSRDGICYVPVQCTRPPCEWTGYAGIQAPTNDTPKPTRPRGVKVENMKYKKNIGKGVNAIKELPKK